MANRKQVEERILQIIFYIDSEQTLKPLIGNLKLFSLEELLQLKDFLESGDYKPIYLLLDKKIKEYLSVMEELNHIRIGKKMIQFKLEEKEDFLQEEKELENILNI